MRILAALLASVMLGSGCAPAPPVPAPSPSLPLTLSPGPTIPVEKTPRDPAAARWTKLADFVAGNLGVVGVEGGYVTAGDERSWFSEDGRAWREMGPRAEQVPNCERWGPPGNELVPDADFAALASSGRAAIVGGAVHDPATCREGVYRPAVWISDDGMTWRRVQFGVQGRVEHVWGDEAGWGAVTDGGEIWTSGDGTAWTQLPRVPGSRDVRVRAVGSGATVLAWTGGSEVDEAELLWTSGGAPWRRVDHLAGCQDEGPELMLAPEREGSGFWLTVGTGTGTMCGSHDLVRWHQLGIPRSFWRSAARIGFPRPMHPDLVSMSAGHHQGAVVVSMSARCSDCPTAAWQYVISTDALRWAQLGPGVPLRAFTSGPAGLIGLHSDGDPPSESVWRLDW